MIASRCCCTVVCLVAVVASPARGQVAAPPDTSLVPAVTSPGDAPRPKPPKTLLRLFRAAVNDFDEFRSPGNLFVLTLGGVAAGAVHTSDQRVTNTLSSSSSLRTAFAPGEMLGSAAVQMAAATVTRIVGGVTGSERVSALGSDLIRAQIVTQVVTAGVKMSVRRTRPDGTQFSFPSGHSSTTFATATVLQRHFGWKAGLPAYALASYVAASRVQVKRHYLSDVTLGAAIGIIGGRAVTVGRGDARFAVSPAPVPGGAALNLSWLGRR